MDLQTKLLWFTTVAAGAACLGQALKTGAAQALLAKLGVPAMPAAWVPRLTLTVGLLAGVATALAAGEPVASAVLTALQGVLAGALPTALHEVVKDRTA